MSNKPRGFTLLELLIVIAIIGILATAITPSVLNKIQEAKQKGTMRDIKTIADACIAYIVDNDEAPAAGSQEGPLIAGNDFIKAITQKHLTTCPVNDRWGNPFVIYSGTSVASYGGFTSSMAGLGDFLIISYGRYGVPDGFTFDPNNREAGMYKIEDQSDFEKDLVNWNGSWIRAPSTSG